MGESEDDCTVCLGSSSGLQARQHNSAVGKSTGGVSTYVRFWTMVAVIGLFKKRLQILKINKSNYLRTSMVGGI